MGNAWLNLGSIVLGLAAWILPLLAIACFKKNRKIHGTYMVYIGLASAVLSLVSVIAYRYHLIGIEDWSALIDTNGGFQFASVVMSALAIAISGLALVFQFKWSKRN